MEENLKMTCLHDKHVALGALMSPFAGFDMPIQYTNIVDEHNAVRGNVGVFDVSHMGEVFISGSDAVAFVNHIVSNDVSNLLEGKIVYTMMLYPDGGVVDDLLVYRQAGENNFLLVINASNIDKDVDWMVRNSDGYDVIIDNRSEEWAQLAIQGPQAEKTMVEVLDIKDCTALGFYEFYQAQDIIVSRTGYTGEDGFEIYSSPEIICSFWDKLLAAGVKPCGLGCRDTLRFEAGMPLYGDELSAEISPVEAGLTSFCKLDKGEFIGKDAISQQISCGPKRKLVGIEVHDKAIPRAGYPVELEDGTQVGVVTTGYRSITLDRSICFALVASEYAALGTPLWIHIRKKVFPGEVIKKRFYKTKYKK